MGNTIRIKEADKNKLDGIEEGATKNKVGANITNTNGTISVVNLTTNLEFNNITSGYKSIGGTVGGNDYWRVGGGATGSNAGYLEIATADDGNEPIYVRQYSSGKFVTLARTATLLDASGNTSFPGNIYEGGTKLSDKYCTKTELNNAIGAALAASY